MEVILLERVAKLGQMGEVVRVKDGFARNFLLPKGKALRATKDNKTKFEGMKAELEARNLAAKGDADKIGSKLDGKSFVVLRQASEAGQLYGSVSPRDLARCSADGGFEVDRNQIALNAPIKTIGSHKVPVLLHPEVEVTITVNVARSADEAERHRARRGRHRAPRRHGRRGRREAAEAAAEAFFEPEAASPRTKLPARTPSRPRRQRSATSSDRSDRTLVEDIALRRRRRRRRLGAGGGDGGCAAAGGAAGGVAARGLAPALAALALRLGRSPRPAGSAVRPADGVDAGSSPGGGG